MLHVTRVGRKPEHETCVFPCKVAAAGDEGQLLCEAGAAWIVSTRNRFFNGVLQRVDANRNVMAA